MRVSLSVRVRRNISKPAFVDPAWERVERDLYGDDYDRYGDERIYDITAKFGGRTVGFARVWIYMGLAVLDELIVREEFRGRQVGRKLLERTELLARKHHCHKLRLETDDRRSAAVALYRSAGFRKEASLPHEEAKRATAIYSKRLS